MRKLLFRHLRAMTLLFFIPSMSLLADGDDYFAWLISKGSAATNGNVIEAAGADTAQFFLDDIALREKMIGRPLILGTHGPSWGHLDTMIKEARASGGIKNNKYIFLDQCYGCQNASRGAAQTGLPVVAPVSEIINAPLDGSQILWVKSDEVLSNLFVAAVPRKDGTVNQFLIPHPERLFKSGASVVNNSMTMPLPGTARGLAKVGRPLLAGRAAFSMARNVTANIIGSELLVELIARKAAQNDPTGQRLLNYYDSLQMSPAQAFNRGQVDYQQSLVAEQDEYINTVSAILSSGGQLPPAALRRSKDYQESQQNMNWEKAALRELRRCE